MLSKYIFILLFFIVVHGISGQQPGRYSLYMLNPYKVNSAYAGFDGSLSVSGAFRNQWQGLEGGPKSQWFSAHAPVYKLHGSVGAVAEREELGVETNLQFTASYNYVQEVKLGYFSFGLNMGFVQKTIDGTLLRAREGIYSNGNFTHNDNNIPLSESTTIAPQLGLAIYHLNDYFEGGVSFNRLVNPALKLEESEIAIDQLNDLNVILKSQFYMSEDFRILPSLLLKTDFIQWQAELSYWLDYRDLYGAGMGVRGFTDSGLDALFLMVGLRVDPKWKLHYAYDIDLNELNSIHSGTHEFQIIYILDRKLGEPIYPPTINNPRFLD